MPVTSLISSPGWDAGSRWDKAAHRPCLFFLLRTQLDPVPGSRVVASAPGRSEQKGCGRTQARPMETLHLGAPLLPGSMLSAFSPSDGRQLQDPGWPVTPISHLQREKKKPTSVVFSLQNVGLSVSIAVVLMNTNGHPTLSLF